MVGGGTAEAGSQLEYVIRVNNIGSLPATGVVVTDDLNPPLGDQVTYVPGSGTLNGSTAGVVYAGAVLTATCGDLQPGAPAVVRFRVQIDLALAIGTTITNTGLVRWNTPAQTASASVSIDVGGTPGSASLGGNVWHDANLNKVRDCSAENCALADWSVDLYRNGLLVTTVLTDAAGAYRLTGLAPNAGTSDLYELRFRAPGAGPNTASMGQGDSPFTDGPQRIGDITVASGANLQNLNLPLWPNGTVYNSVARVPIAGATVAMRNAATGAVLPDRCFDDPAQQNQVTAADGFYKFDLNFGDASCPAGGGYLVEVTPPAAGYVSAPSRIIPPASDASTPAFSVPACPGNGGDAVPATPYCEVVASAAAPPPSVPPGPGTVYYQHLVLSNGNVPGESQVFNNSIPIDPTLYGAVAISKTSSLTNVTRGTLVPYTITVTNVYGTPLDNLSIVDRFPAGFKYVAGSARLDGNPAEPLINGRELAWNGLQLQFNQKRAIRLLLVVGSGVSEGEYVNWAAVLNAATGGAVSGEATATVRVAADPDFDCTDVIGKVFDDANLNGEQDSGEKGLFGVRVVTARGLIASTDSHGRFHITCATVPDEDRGSNFILKLDERSLPSGYRPTTENPRVQRATRGKMLRFGFGAAIHRVVRLDIADGAFEPGTARLRMPWTPRIPQLLEELTKAPSVLR
ncbi:MAG TPA: SdrD B-like domain-containing protein, partial [Arthrobacter sp.]